MLVDVYYNHGGNNFDFNIYSLSTTSLYYNNETMKFYYSVNNTFNNYNKLYYNNKIKSLFNIHLDVSKKYTCFFTNNERADIESLSLNDTVCQAFETIFKPNKYNKEKINSIINIELRFNRVKIYNEKDCMNFIITLLNNYYIICNYKQWSMSYQSVCDELEKIADIDDVYYILKYMANIFTGDTNDKCKKRLFNIIKEDESCNKCFSELYNTGSMDDFIANIVMMLEYISDAYEKYELLLLNMNDNKYVLYYYDHRGLIPNRDIYKFKENIILKKIKRYIDRRRDGYDRRRDDRFDRRRDDRFDRRRDDEDYLVTDFEDDRTKKRDDRDKSESREGNSYR